jgi:ABC-2 type transport system permease protein
MVIASLVRKDLKRIVSDRKALVVNLALPLLLTTIMGLSFGGGLTGNSGISAIPIAMVANDMPTMMKENLAEGLQDSDFFTVTWTDSTGADAMVRAGEVAAAVVFPEDLTAQFIDGRDISVAVWKDPGSPLKAGIVQEILSRMMVRMQAGEAAYNALWPEDRAGAGTESDDGFLAEEYFSGDFNDIWKRFRNADNDPVLQEAADRFMTVMDHQVALSDGLSVEQITLTVNDKAPAGQAAEAGDINLFDYFLPSFSVFFLMFGVAAGARDIHREREQLTLQRQLLSPMTGTQFIIAKWFSTALQGALQLGVLFMAGAMLFQVNLGPDSYSLALTILLTSTAAASVFILLALLSPTEKVMDNLSTVVILVSAMVGGNFMPVESMPVWLKSFGHYVFNYWANLSFSEVVVKNHGLSEALLPTLVLASITVTLFVVNVVIFSVRARRGGLV